MKKKSNQIFSFFFFAHTHKLFFSLNKTWRDDTFIWKKWIQNNCISKISWNYFIIQHPNVDGKKNESILSIHFWMHRSKKKKFFCDMDGIIYLKRKKHFNILNLFIRCIARIFFSFSFGWLNGFFIAIKKWMEKKKFENQIKKIWWWFEY